MFGKGIYRNIPNNEFLALINANAPNAGNPFATIADLVFLSQPVEVANYSALPDPTTVEGKVYIVLASQGTAWLPGSLGGTYYPEGFYYSDGTNWIYSKFPYNATLAVVNTGTNNTEYVTPYTFTEADKWNTKANTSHTHILSEVTDVTMTVSNLNSLDDGADSTLHFHNSDRNRTNHTGTQTSSTISDFASTVLATLLTGLSTATIQVIVPTDTILLALGYLQAQITALIPSPKIKSGAVTSGTFAGNPKKATVTFGTAFADANYSVSIVGIDSRSWAIETVAAGSFVINANANGALTGNVYWTATKHGEN